MTLIASRGISVVSQDISVSINQTSLQDNWKCKFFVPASKNRDLLHRARLLAWDLFKKYFKKCQLTGSNIKSTDGLSEHFLAPVFLPRDRFRDYFSISLGLHKFRQKKCLESIWLVNGSPPRGKFTLESSSIFRIFPYFFTRMFWEPKTLFRISLFGTL